MKMPMIRFLLEKMPHRIGMTRFFAGMTDKAVGITSHVVGMPYKLLAGWDGTYTRYLTVFNNCNS